MALTKLNYTGQGTIPIASIPTITRAKMPTGAVLQVKEGIFNTQIDLTSSYSNSGLSVSITPTSSSSKIFVITNVHLFNNGVGLLGLRVLRDSTVIVESNYAHSYGDNHGKLNVLTKLDLTPNTTNAIDYKVQFKITQGSGTYRMNQATGGSRITVMEIAG